LALKDLSLAIKSVAGPFALPDRDVTELAFGIDQESSRRVPANCDVFEHD